VFTLIELCGDRNREGYLTSFSENDVSVPKGRPSELSDPQLSNRRNQFVQIFEGVWSEIEWGLRKCKNADDLIRIVAPIADPGSWVCGPLSIFCRESSESPSGEALRKLRAERKAIVEPYRVADEETRRAYEQLRQVNRAVDQAPKDKLRIVKRARKLKRKQYWRAALECRNLREREQRLDWRVTRTEASFARNEIFRFLKKKRYALTPINLASAAAGLPYMGYRQSIRRAKKSKCLIANGLSYQIFKAVRYLVHAANKKTANALVNGFREGVLSLPVRYRLPQAELAQNWWFLEPAIRRAYRTHVHPGALAGELTKLYFKQIRTCSDVDRILAEQAKLGFSHQSRARQTQK
jgi:hypothetical protein